MLQKMTVIILSILCLMTEVSMANQTLATAVRNALVLPLKQIHDALEPLEEIRDDLTSIATYFSTPRQPVRCLLGHNDVIPRDCGDLYNAGHTASGVYNIYVYSAGQAFPVSVYCDMHTDGGGWLVFQRRQDGSENFYRNWNKYEMGFGNISREFWLGNEFLHLLTDRKPHELRVDLGDHEGHSAYAKYNDFYVGSRSSQFTLTVSGYSGNAGDSLTRQNGHKFSTKDRDNDAHGPFSCAQCFLGAWWYADCLDSNLNGMYQQIDALNTSSSGVWWHGWKNRLYSLKFTEMKIRSVDY